jgi:curved DNA-binding protein CbpA
VTHYDVLGVAPSAPVAEVRRAYVALARQHHPDRPGGDAATMRAVNEAWTVLGDPGRRARYDRSLHPATSAPPAAPVTERVRTDDEELLADLADDTPLGGRIVLPRWLSLLPVAVFAASVGTFVAGVMFSSPPALAVGFALFVLSCALFLAAPFVALLSSRRGNR